MLSTMRMKKTRNDPHPLGSYSAGSSMDELRNVHILVEGRVQGVGFRYFVKNIAADLHINGWVRNRFDERVEILAQGTAADLARFVAAVRVGPSSALVTDLVTDWPPVVSQFDRFSVAPSI